MTIEKSITVGEGENCQHDNSVCYVYVKAIDGVGNVSEEDYRVFNISWTPPGAVFPVMLTISSTPGGSVIWPGEGEFPHSRGIEALLRAEADSGCGFANWTGGIETITNVNEAETTIVMNDNYSIVANFECY